MARELAFVRTSSDSAPRAAEPSRRAVSPDAPADHEGCRDPSRAQPDNGPASLRVKVVLAVAEEDEVAIGEPLEERPGLTGVLGGGPGGCRLKAGRQPLRALVHRRPVFDRGANLVERVVDLLAQLGEPLRIGLARDLGVKDRLGNRPDSLLARLEDAGQAALAVAPHPNDGMDHEVDRVAEAGERHRHGIDDERHVLADDLYDRAGWAPVMVAVGVVDPHVRRAWGPLRRELPLRHGGLGELIDAALGQVLRGQPLVVLTHERLPSARLRAKAFTHLPADRVDQVGLDLRSLQRHSSPRVPRLSAQPTRITLSG